MTGATDHYAAQAKTGLSPEWDRGFDEAFTEIVTSDPDLLREEFDALVGANFDEPPQPPASAAPPAGRPGPPRDPTGPGATTPTGSDGPTGADPNAIQRSPP